MRVRTVLRVFPLFAAAKAYAAAVQYHDGLDSAEVQVRRQAKGFVVVRRSKETR